MLRNHKLQLFVSWLAAMLIGVAFQIVFGGEVSRGYFVLAVGINTICVFVGFYLGIRYDVKNQPKKKARRLL